MKRFFLTVFISVMLMIAGSQAVAGRESIFIVVKVSNVLTVLMEDESNKNLFSVYEIQLNSQCALSNFAVNDVLSVDASSDIPQIGDSIKSKISLTDLFADEILLNNCQIIQIVPKFKDNVDIYSFINLGGNNYFFESFNNDRYLIEYQSSCLADKIDNLAIIFVTRGNSGGLANGDSILYALKMDFINPITPSFEFVEFNNCPVGQVSPVSYNEAEYLSTDWADKSLMINDLDADITLKLKVDSNCKLLSSGFYDLGEISYYQQNSQPIYVSFIDNDDIWDAIFDIGLLLKDSICRVISYEIISEPTQPAIPPTYLYQLPESNINIPVLTHYTIGKWGKKIYTDRPAPETMIGAMVKGETDPATYIVDSDGTLRWLKNESVARRLFGDDWDSQIIWFNDSIIYTYKFGATIEY